MMRRSRFYLYVVVLLSLCVFAGSIAPLATADDFTWTGGGGSTDWTDPLNWSSSTAPGAFPASGDAVFFEGVVEVGSGSASSLQNSGTLTIRDDDSAFVSIVSGQIDNSGEIILGPDTGGNNSPGFPDQRISLTGTPSLTGGGTIRLNGPDVGFNGGTITNVDNTIRGSGLLSRLTLVNQSDLIAEGGTLEFLGASITNEGGSVRVASDGVLELIGPATLSGGTVAVDSGGLATLQTYFAEGVTFAGAGTVELRRSSLVDVTNETHVRIVSGASGGDVSLGALGGTIENRGTITFEELSSTDIRISSETTLTGGGTLTLAGSGNGFANQTGGDIATLNNINHTIRGQGKIENILLNNQGSVIAENGTLVLRNTEITGDGELRILDGAEISAEGDVRARQLTVEGAGDFVFRGTRLEVTDFIGSFDHTEGTYAPGASPAVSTLTGDYIATGGSLEIEIEGTAIGDYDQLQVGGDVTLSGVDLSVVSLTGFMATPGDVFDIVTVGGAQRGLFRSDTLLEGATVATLGSPLRITYQAGDGNDIALFATTNPTSVVFSTAQPGDEVYFIGNRGLTLEDNAFAFDSFEILDGQGFTLGPNETLVLDDGNGTLFIREGAVFSGNGVIDGNVINAGLLRIPIVRVYDINRVSGSVIEIITPDVPQLPPNDPTPVEVQPRTFVSFICDTCSGGGVPGSGVRRGGGGVVESPVTNSGVVAWDASLEITGSYEQTETGAMRMFIAGLEAGVNYSQLIIGEDVMLDGEIQIVFQPDLFSAFDYAPEVGQSFDLITAVDGITLAPGLSLANLVAVQGSDLLDLSTYSVSRFDSGFDADPDNLWLIEETLFSLELVENDTILRATLIEAIPLLIPEPKSLFLLSAYLVLISVRSHRSKLSRF